MKVSKKLFAVLAMAMALAVALFVTGCGGPSPEEIEEGIRADVTERLDILKDPESEEYQQLLSMMEDQASTAELEAYGVTGEDIMTSLFDGYVYEITSVERDQENGTADVEVAVTCKSLSDIESGMYDAVDGLYDEVYANPEKFMNMSEDELNAYAGEFMMGVFDETEPRETDLSLTYSEGDGGQWEADEDPFNELATCFM